MFKIAMSRVPGPEITFGFLDSWTSSLQSRKMQMSPHSPVSRHCSNDGDQKIRLFLTSDQRLPRYREFKFHNLPKWILYRTSTLLFLMSAVTVWFIQGYDHELSGEIWGFALPASVALSLSRRPHVLSCVSVSPVRGLRRSAWFPFLL